MKKGRLVIAVTLLLLLTTYNPKELFLSSKFNIKLIKFENNFIVKDEQIKKDLAYLYDKNLFFLDKSHITKVLKQNNFIDSFELKKIYFKQIIIKIFEKNPIAILHYKKEKFYIIDNMEIVNFLNLKIEKNLPIVFGDIENFKILYKNLKKNNFPLNSISTYYFYKTNRWDLEINNKRLIKLPPKKYIKSLENFLELQKEKSYDKYKVFDYRITKQLILK